MKNLDNSHHAAALGLGIGGKQPMLSAERRHKLREQATQKLARAYRLDEIACSVATMQSASSLEDVASLVLRRDPNSLDAKYVHFFHEKIPSRQLAESTSLHVLDQIISHQPSECEALRTRATVKVFKEDYKGAAKDLTEALSIFKGHQRHKTADAEPGELQPFDRNSRRVDVSLDEDQQPSSLQVQLLFARAGVLLSIACLSVSQALEPLPSAKVRETRPGTKPGNTNGAQDTAEEAGTEESGTSTPVTDGPPELTAEESAAEARIMDARKVVKLHAKKALRDYMAYLSNFYYSPNFPADLSDEIARKIVAIKQKGRRQASNFNNSDSPHGDGEYTVYELSDLFVAAPPTDLPPYPPADITVLGPAPDSAISVGPTVETVSYHPLLTDALHSLLLCHVLVQTSTKELQRHAHMVARLARLADGQPIFQASRSPARADWIEILRQCNNWIGLSSSWETLCSNTPLLSPGTKEIPKQAIRRARPAPGSASAKELEEKNKEAIHQEALRRAFEDDTVGDQQMFRVAYEAHKRSVEADFSAQQDRALGNAVNNSNMSEAGATVPGSNGAASPSNSIQDGKPKPASIDTKDSAHSNGGPHSPGTAHKVWSQDEGREYPILTQRASAVAKWQREAPQGAGSTVSSSSKKKKKAAPAVAPLASSDSFVDAINASQQIESRLGREEHPPSKQGRV